MREYKPLGIKNYVIPSNKRYYEAILEKGHVISLKTEVGYNGPWKIKEHDSFGIVAPENDKDNIAAFTHELLHIYCDFYLNMHIPAIRQILLCMKYLSLTQHPEVFQHGIINIINNLQHHKMLPIFIECGFKKEEFLGNYSELIEPDKNFLEMNVTSDTVPVIRFAYALQYADYLCIEQFAINEKVREYFIRTFSAELKHKNEKLHQQYSELLVRWDNNSITLPELIPAIVDVADKYADGGFY